MTVFSVWALSIPLPAVLIIAVSFYLLMLVIALWCRHCFKAQCSPWSCDCCSSLQPGEYCLACAESCDCQPPSLRSCLNHTCTPPSCAMWDCACTCQPPDCESINCLCFEIKFR
ncbi:hypothetical protein COCON_G00201800 [Conger conger]|uniref:Uncharacterized protein n=1 Tax=Conger conger TaxID=82655 RepID=A0A9Q1HPJ2_CONCO|nr:uncharacterized protein si:ch211-198p11.6 [Conger conger]KAJ8253568.1 hypothetical protein COCON_G00201800 [Conger conger]